MDVDSIAPGRDFGEAIECALNECAVLLTLTGPAWTSAVDAHGRRRLDDPDDLVVLERQAALDRAIPSSRYSWTGPQRRHGTTCLRRWAP